MIETYIPLYRKYRPQQFSDLVGQEVVSTAVSNALALRKIAHAYLFCGPRGTGKTSSARILAKSLNCESGPTATPCQTCASCTSITQGTAVDVIEIDAASNNGVEHIREITEKVQFSAMYGKYKVYIIDEVHMLSKQAFNALLKTLEEPPPNVVFIFATTEPHKVLPTIISRCQRFDFSRITKAQIESHLKQVAEWENIRISDAAIRLIGRSARGGLRDALGLLDQVSVLGRASEAEQCIEPEDVRSFIGILEEDLVFDLAQGIIGKDPQVILMQTHLFQERGVEPVQLVKELTQHFRNLLITKACGDQGNGDLLEVSDDHYPKLCEQASRLETEEIPQMLSRLSLMESQIRNSQQPLLWLEVGLLDLTYRQEIYLVKTLSERVDQLEAMLSQGSAPVAKPAGTRPAPPARPVAAQPVPPPVEPKQPTLAQPVSGSQAPSASAVSPHIQSQETPPPVPEQTAHTAGSDLRQTWQQILAAIPSVPTQSLARDHFILLDVAPEGVIIGYTNDTIMGVFKRSTDKTDNLSQAVQAVLGKTYPIRFRLNNGPTTTAPEPAPVANASTATEVLPSSLEEAFLFSQVAPAPVAVPAGALPTPPEPDETPLPSLSELEQEGLAFEMNQAKKYTQELFQGRVID